MGPLTRVQRGTTSDTFSRPKISPQELLLAMDERSARRGFCELKRGGLLNSKGVEMPGFIAHSSLEMIYTDTLVN